MMKTIDPSGPAPWKILVVRLSAVGDVVRTIPAVQALRRHFPDSTIHWLVEDRCSELLEGLPGIDALRIVPRRQWKKMGKLAWLGAFRKLLRSLKAEQYDLFMDYHGILKSGIYGALCRIPRRIGYPKGIAKEMNTLFNNEILPPHDPRMSRYTRNLLMTQYLDPGAVEERPGLPLGESDRLFASEFLALSGLDGRPFAFLYPGTSPRGRYKRWEPVRYGELVDRLTEMGLPALIGWGPGEETIVAEIQKSTRGETVVPPLTTLKQLGALLERATLFIGGDTGPMHMASLLGTPVVTLFGPSDPVINEPARFTPFRIVYAGVDCSPCRKKDCRTLACMNDISVGMVMDAVNDLLEEVRNYPSQ